MPLPPRLQQTLAPSQDGVHRELLVFVIVASMAAACASAPSRMPTDRSAVGKFSAPVTDLQFIGTGVGVGAEAQPGMFVVVH